MMIIIIMIIITMSKYVSKWVIFIRMKYGDNTIYDDAMIHDDNMIWGSGLGYDIIYCLLYIFDY